MTPVKRSFHPQRDRHPQAESCSSKELSVALPVIIEVMVPRETEISLEIQSQARNVSPRKRFHTALITCGRDRVQMMMSGTPYPGHLLLSINLSLRAEREGKMI